MTIRIKTSGLRAIPRRGDVGKAWYEDDDLCVEQWHGGAVKGISGAAPNLKKQPEGWTMAWFILMIALLPVSALGSNLVIPTDSPQIEIRDVKFYRLSYGFQEEEPGRFQLQANLRYRKWTNHIERVKHFTFRLQFGAIVQHDDQTLVLRLNNREMVVGKHRWWYSPYWQAAEGVRVACDQDQPVSRVVLTNCRLIVSPVEKRVKEMKAVDHGHPVKKRETS